MTYDEVVEQARTANKKNYREIRNHAGDLFFSLANNCVVNHQTQTLHRFVNMQGESVPIAHLITLIDLTVKILDDSHIAPKPRRKYIRTKHKLQIMENSYE